MGVYFVRGKSNMGNRVLPQRLLCAVKSFLKDFSHAGGKGAHRNAAGSCRFEGSRSSGSSSPLKALRMQYQQHSYVHANVILYMFTLATVCVIFRAKRKACPVHKAWSMFRLNLEQSVV